jgi:NADH dehydrogenase [ubiquinone] 1 alpha subcomplex assembly factor 7
MIALHFISIWKQNYKIHGNNDLHLIELGPGNGTLLHDIIRTFHCFPELFKHLKQIHLVEICPSMKQYQKQRLSEISSTLNIQFSFNPESPLCNDAAVGIPVFWHHDILDIHSDQQHPSYFLLGHEFLDTFPIKQYQFTTSKEWLEIHVQPIHGNPTAENYQDIDNFFELVLRPTKASSIVNDFLSSYLLKRDPGIPIQPGHIYETCPAALDSYKKSLSLIQKKGASLFIDYAYAKPTFKNSLRVSIPFYFHTSIMDIFH